MFSPAQRWFPEHLSLSIFVNHAGLRERTSIFEVGCLVSSLVKAGLAVRPVSRRRPRIPGTTRPRALYVLPAIPDDAPEQLKNALAIRNACAIEGRCPSCGARGELVGPDADGCWHLVFRHEDDCGALLDGKAA
jgi:hypothetical protein